MSQPKMSLFSPKFPKKYAGDPTEIVARSGWEKSMMEYLDENNSVIQWQSEEFFISYYNPIKKRYSRYFPDFFARIKQPDGSIKCFVIEIKPEKQTRIPRKRSRNYLNEATTFAVNISKWRAAKEYCDERGWEFQVVSYDNRVWKFHKVDNNFLLQS